MSEGVVSALLAAIEQVEKAARAVEPLGHNFDMGGHRQDEVFTHGRIRYASEDGMPRSVASNEQQHFSNWEPDSVLRLCRAHRNIIAMYERTKQLLAEANQRVLQHVMDGTVATRQEQRDFDSLHIEEAVLQEVVEGLTEGYGITEQETKR